MKITKESKYVPETQSQTTNSMLISSDLSVQSLYQILTKNPQLINKTDKNGETFLSYALKRKNIDVCEFLLTSPVLDLTFQDDDGNSYLHLAAENKNDTIHHNNASKVLRCGHTMLISRKSNIKHPCLRVKERWKGMGDCEDSNNKDKPMDFIVPSSL